MALSLVTPPTSEPITVDEAKLHLKITPDVTTDDSLIEALITAAREWVETFTHRAVPVQTWDLALDGFPCDGGPIVLPKAPTISITSVTYVATDGTSTVWSSALYMTDLPVGPTARRGTVLPAYGECYPVTRAVPRAVTVRFVAGYLATTAIPDPVPVAMKVCLLEHVRANYGRGTEDRVETMQWIERNLWAYKSF